MSFLHAVSVVFTYVPHIHSSEIGWDHGHNIPSHLHDARFGYHPVTCPEASDGWGRSGSPGVCATSWLSLGSLSLAPSSSCGAWSLATTAETRRHSSALLTLMSKLGRPGRACGLPFLRPTPIFCYKMIPSEPCVGPALPRWPPVERHCFRCYLGVLEVAFLLVPVESRT